MIHPVCVKSDNVIIQYLKLVTKQCETFLYRKVLFLLVFCFKFFHVSFVVFQSSQIIFCFRRLSLCVFHEDGHCLLPTKPVDYVASSAVRKGARTTRELLSPSNNDLPASSSPTAPLFKQSIANIDKLVFLYGDETFFEFRSQHLTFHEYFVFLSYSIQSVITCQIDRNVGRPTF